MRGKRRSLRSKKAKREFERRERERAEHEAKARSESKKRQETIKLLWQDLKQAGPNRITDLVAENDLGAILVDLVGLQKAEMEHMRRFHELCEWAETNAPEKLKDIQFAQVRYWVEGFSRLNPHLELTPKQRSERERQRYNWRGVGLIEYEFGGKGEAEWRKYPWAGLSNSPYQPTCLDDIFAGGAVHMHGLQRLFGMHRNRLAKYFRRFKNARSGRETLYYYRAVVAIMRGLLSEKPQERKAPVRGSPLKVWPSDPDLRTPVLSALQERLNSLSVEEHIKTAFLTVIHRHLPDSAKK